LEADVAQLIYDIELKNKIQAHEFLTKEKKNWINFQRILNSELSLNIQRTFVILIVFHIFQENCLFIVNLEKMKEISQNKKKLQLCSKISFEEKKGS